MSSVIYYNRYPEYKDIQFSNDPNENTAIDFTSIINCIKDFDNAIQESGLIKVLDTVQFDVNNLEQIKYHTQYGTRTIGDIAHEYPALTYTFNDELNVDYPLYIIVNFCFISTITKSSTYNNNHLILGAKITISKTITPDELSVSFYSKHAVSANTNQQSLTETIVSCHVYSNSEIINEKNSLFINLCPNYSPNSTSNKFSFILSLISVLINRRPNGDVLVYASTGQLKIMSTSTTATINPYRVNYDTISTATGLNITTYIMNNTIGSVVSDTTAKQFNPIIQDNIYSLDGNIYINPTAYATNKNYYNYEVCCVDRRTTSTTSRTLSFSSILPDDTQTKYKVIGYPAYPFVFNSTYTSMLLRIE